MTQVRINPRRWGGLDGHGRSRRGTAFGVLLLNLTGTGAGYLVMRRWRRWMAYVAVTLGLASVAVRLDASGAPKLWLTILTLWIVAAALDAVRGAGAIGQRPARRVWALTAVAVFVLLVETELVSSYRSSGQETLATGLAAQARGDCRSALASYRRVTGFYELTLSQAVGVAQRERAGCEQVVEAAQARTAGDLERAVTLYGGLLRSEPPGSELVPHVRRWRFEAAMEWAAELRGVGNHERAIDAYRQVEADAGDPASVKGLIADTHLEWGDGLRVKRTATDLNNAIRVYRRLADSGDAVRAKGRLADTYMELGDSLQAAGDHKGAITQYGIVLSQFGDLAAPAAAASSGLAVINEAAKASIASGKPCAGLPILDALATAGEPFRSQASALTAEAMFACGEQTYREGRIPDAIAQFRSLRERFPNSDQAARAETALIDAEVATVQRGATSPLPPPHRTGGASGRRAVLVIRNDSPRPIEVLVSGPSSKRITLGPCGNCSEVGFAPGACPGRGPQVEVALDPGGYKAVAKVTDGAKVTPFSGTWSVSGSSKYSHCLYIQTTRF